MMDIKNYYAERKGMLQRVPIDLEMLKKVFLMTHQKFEDDVYFQGATGYTCVDYGKKVGLWGHDIDAFIYTKLKMKNIWPIQENIENFDEPTLFTVIEFLYDYVSEPVNKTYHEWNDCGWHCSKFDKEKGREKFRNEINEILNDYDVSYQLTKEGEIQKMPPTGFESIIEEPAQTDQPDNIDKRVENAISKYLRYGSTQDDKKEAIRTLADVLEFLKTGDIILPSRDDSDLFNIINNFDIRHHNRLQSGDYDKELWYDWMFYTFLASIKMLLKLKETESAS